MSERLVVLAPNWLGDAVMALPAFADLRRHFPDAHIAVAARPPVAPMFTMVDGVDEVITLPGGGGLRAWTGWSRDVDALSGGSFDTAILFPNSYGTARIVAKAGIAERWGYATDWRGSLLTRAIPKPRRRAASARLLPGADDGAGRFRRARRTRACGRTSSGRGSC